MRKTWDSSKTSWTRALSFFADSRSVPNGFSMMIRARSTRLPACSCSSTDSAALGGTER